MGKPFETVFTYSGKLSAIIMCAESSDLVQGLGFAVWA